MPFKTVGIIGSGSVGQALGLKFAQTGSEVAMGTRSPEKAAEWLTKAGPKARAISNADAAKFGELLVVCTKWDGTENAIQLAGKEHFNGKIVIDTTNPLVFTAPSAPPVPAFGFPNSSGKKIQEWLPEAKVVKCFNIVPANYMGHPSLQEGNPTMFICGNDADAKKAVQELLRTWGWMNVADLGDISQSYLLENLAIMWIRYGFLNNHWTHAFKMLMK